MTVDVTVEATIPAELEEVAAYVADPSHAPTWYQRIESVEILTDPPLGVGSRMAFRARFLGRDLAYVYEIVEWEPGRRLVMSTADGPFPMTTEYEWHRSGDSTLMRLRNHGRPSGFGRVVAPIMSTAMKRAMRGDLRRLAAILCA